MHSSSKMYSNIGFAKAQPLAKKSKSHRRRKSRRRPIDRRGLHGMGGDEFLKTEPDPLTVSILEEIRFLPRNRRGKGTTSKFTGSELLSQAGLLLKRHASRPPVLTETASDSTDRASHGELGFSGQQFYPFKLQRVFGRSVLVKEVLNFSGTHGSHVVYVASNVLVFFDYYHDKQSVLQGHHSRIVGLAKDDQDRFMATVDAAEPPALIVWVVQTGFPLTTIRIAPDHEEVQYSDVVALAFIGGRHSHHIGILHRVKDLDVVDESSSITQALSIWNFVLAQPRLDVTTLIPFRKEGSFHHKILASTEYPEHFVTFGKRTILFCTWFAKERRVSTYQAKDHLNHFSRIGYFTTAAVWIEESVLVGTTNGYLVEFRLRKPMGLEEPTDPNLNTKEFRRYIYIHEDAAITTIVLHKDVYIVIGDSEGGVRFLDTKFRVLRWTRTNREIGISSIAFSSSHLVPSWKLEMRAAHAKHRNTVSRERYGALRYYSYHGPTHVQRPPSTLTVERDPLHGDYESLDLVAGYDDGSVAYYHIAEEKMDVIVPEALCGGVSIPAVMDVSPTTTHFVLCTTAGEIQLYDYSTNEVIVSRKIFERDVTINKLRFHPSGAFFVLGSSKGTLYFRRTYTLETSYTTLKVSTSSGVDRIEFSTCGLHLGVVDSKNTVTLLHFSGTRSAWKIKGKHQSHYRRITDLCFFKDPTTKSERLFSLGEDRRLVEYDLANSEVLSGLAILKTVVLEPTAFPTAMVFAPGFPGHEEPILHYATTNNKIRVFDQDTFKIRKTCQAPVYGGPITKMILISPNPSTIGATIQLIVTAEEQKLGLIKTPVTGNPFGSMAVYAHPGAIKEILVGLEGREIFTLGTEDNVVFRWNPEIVVLENSIMTAGHGVVPFMRHLDYGLPPESSLVGDIEDIFYHMMIKEARTHQEFLCMSRQIKIGDIPTVMRTCGYFPMEQEVEEILEEARFLLDLKYGGSQVNISFEDFLVLFANHRVNDALNVEVHRAFDILGETNDASETCIARETFVKLITTRAEKFQEVDLPHFLSNFYLFRKKSTLWSRFSRRKSTKSSIDFAPYTSRLSFARSSLGSLRSGRSKEDIVEPSMSGRDVVNESRVAVTLEVSESVVKHSSKAMSKVSFGGNMLGIAAVDDETENLPVAEMPKDITTNFFIRQLLPDDVIGGLYLDRNEYLDNIHALEAVFEKQPAQNAVSEQLKRWGRRDDWRYVKEMYNKLKTDKVPMEERYKTAMDLEEFCQMSEVPAYQSFDSVNPEDVDEEVEKGSESDDDSEPERTDEAERNFALPTGEADLVKSKRTESVVKVKISEKEKEEEPADVVEPAKSTHAMVSEKEEGQADVVETIPNPAPTVADETDEETDFSVEEGSESDEEEMGSGIDSTETEEET